MPYGTAEAACAQHAACFGHEDPMLWRQSSERRSVAHGEAPGRALRVLLAEDNELERRDGAASFWARKRAW